MRAGRYIKETTGYRAFYPEPLPPINPALGFDAETIRLLSEADRKLGQLSGMSSLLPNKDLFVGFYVKKEAILSSQIEGITCTMEDLFQYVPASNGVQLTPVGEIVNYVKALNYGIERLKTLPLSLRLIQEVHGKLLENGPGNYKSPGEFRTSQNWIGPAGCTLQTASFIPPPPHSLMDHLGTLENFIHSDHKLPILVLCALVHAQFETIHPFLDGNGRVGRLLVSLMLHDEKALDAPLLYMSLFLKENKEDYYQHLTNIRNNGDWEGWVQFFIKGVGIVCDDAIKTVQAVDTLKRECNEKIATMTMLDRLALDSLFEEPVLDVRSLEKKLNCSFNKASLILKNLEETGIVVETTGQKRHRTFKFKQYMDLFEPEDPASSLKNKFSP